MLDDFKEEGNVDIAHKDKGIYFNAAKLIRIELKESARLERTKLQQCAEDE